MQSKNIFGGKLKTEDAIRFIVAGHAVVTFKNSDTNCRYTYKIRRTSKESPYFVSVLKSMSWTYLGVIFKNDTTGVVNYVHGKKSCIMDNEQCAKVFKYVFDKLIIRRLPKVVEIWHEGKCGRCGRKLTVPESIENGLGPHCMKKLGTYLKR